MPARYTTLAGVFTPDGGVCRKRRASAHSAPPLLLAGLKPLNQEIERCIRRDNGRGTTRAISEFGCAFKDALVPHSHRGNAHILPLNYAAYAGLETKGSPTVHTAVKLLPTLQLARVVHPNLLPRFRKASLLNLFYHLFGQQGGPQLLVLHQNIFRYDSLLRKLSRHVKRIHRRLRVLVVGRNHTAALIFFLLPFFFFFALSRLALEKKSLELSSKMARNNFVLKPFKNDTLTSERRDDHLKKLKLSIQKIHAHEPYNMSFEELYRCVWGNCLLLFLSLASSFLPLENACPIFCCCCCCTC